MKGANFTQNKKTKGKLNFKYYKQHDTLIIMIKNI